MKFTASVFLILVTFSFANARNTAEIILDEYPVQGFFNNTGNFFYGMVEGLQGTTSSSDCLSNIPGIRDAFNDTITDVLNISDDLVNIWNAVDHLRSFADKLDSNVDECKLSQLYLVIRNTLRVEIIGEIVIKYYIDQTSYDASLSKISSGWSAGDYQLVGQGVGELIQKITNFYF